MVAGDRLADRIGIGVLAKVFTPELVDRVVEQAGVREQRTRTLPARVGVRVDVQSRVRVNVQRLLGVSAGAAV